MIAYFDCFSGASGDMIVGALLDAGLPLDDLRAALAGLPLRGYALEAAPARKGPLGGTQFTVRVDPAVEQPHRHLADILALIEAGGLPRGAAEQAREVFLRLGEAEARVHRQPLEEVHFHEVGAVDSIVDIVGAAVGLHLLGVEQVYCSALPAGGGWRQVAHGWIPLPGPATLEVLATAGAPLVPDDSGAELVTPTGAAILATLSSFTRPPMTVRRVGYGAGQADLPRPNLLRVCLGEALASAASAPSGPGPADEMLLVLETAIDDMNPQVLGYLFDALLADGALDVYCTPITMKKNRPATLLSVLCRVEDATRLRDRVLRETTTLGVRLQTVWRHAAGREVRRVETIYGPVRLKVKLLDGAVAGATPEYDDCVALAGGSGVPLQEVLRVAHRAADALFGPLARVE